MSKTVFLTVGWIRTLMWNSAYSSRWANLSASTVGSPLGLMVERPSRARSSKRYHVRIGLDLASAELVVNDSSTLYESYRTLTARNPGRKRSGDTSQAPAMWEGLS
jgi:hypothetical protein